jgi:hypothetical protein
MFGCVWGLKEVSMAVRPLPVSKDWKRPDATWTDTSGASSLRDARLDCVILITNRVDAAALLLLTSLVS